MLNEECLSCLMLANLSRGVIHPPNSLIGFKTCGGIGVSHRQLCQSVTKAT
jgi:predicted metal-binding protein